LEKSLRVLFLASEANPIIKVGGLGDVAGSLPRALRQISNPIDIRLAIPFHGEIRRGDYPFKQICTFDIPYPADRPRGRRRSSNFPGVQSGKAEVQCYGLDLEGLPVYAISGDLIPSDAPVYSPNSEMDKLKYAFFSLASLEMVRQMDWRPDIVHANDWHTALSIYSLIERRKTDAFYRSTATIMGLHNLPYLGPGLGDVLPNFGLSPASDSALPRWAQDMPLPLGLLSADRIVTVSPSYAREILTPEFGVGLESFFRSRAADISGILNGLDNEEWNPLTDLALEKNYSLQNLEERAANKTKLQSEMRLEKDTHVPLMAMVTRLDRQKGVDLVPEAFRHLIVSPTSANRSWQLVVLGVGDPELEYLILEFQKEIPRRVRTINRFDGHLSRRIYAGADILLIPSRYEPCGLTQMIAMRYGCIPIARATGGLLDTVVDFDRSEDSVGFTFHESTPHALTETLGRALQVFRDQETWQGMQQRGMKRDFSWRRSAQQYLELYSDLVSRRIDR
jgi:starch synthase